MSEQAARDGSQQSPLHTERGSTTISDSVLSQVAGMAVQEVGGMQMGGGAARTVGEVLDSVSGNSGRTRGVSVEVGQEEAAIDLDMGVNYGRPIPKTSEAVVGNVIDGVENTVGLRVTEVNITVNDVLFPEEVRFGQQQRS